MVKTKTALAWWTQLAPPKDSLHPTPAAPLEALLVPEQPAPPYALQESFSAKTASHSLCATWGTFRGRQSAPTHAAAFLKQLSVVYGPNQICINLMNTRPTLVTDYLGPSFTQTEYQLRLFQAEPNGHWVGDVRPRNAIGLLLNCPGPVPVAAELSSQCGHPTTLAFRSNTGIDQLQIAL